MSEVRGHIFTEKHQAIIDACEHLKTLIQTSVADDDLDSAYNALLDEHDDYLKKEQREFEDVYVFFRAFAASIEYHIKKDNLIHVGEGGLKMLDLYDQTIKSNILSEQEKEEIGKIVNPIMMEARLYMYNKKHPGKKIQYARTPEHKCLLCRTALATKTGSHLVSNFLIQKYFAYDGSSKRDKEVVESYSITNDDYRTYLGHRVGGGITEELMGHELNDEEIARENKKPNLLMRDYFFCPECENRFGTIETYYADILSGKEKKYPPYIPYLFWLSIIWRMSVGRLAIHMKAEHEQRIGKVLDKALDVERGKIKGDGLGHSAYRIARTADFKGETPCIIGVHDASMPYTCLIGDYALWFYPSVNQAMKEVKSKVIDLLTINTGQKEEVISELPFIDFWLTKRHIMDSVYKHPDAYDGTAIQDLAQLKRYEKEGQFLKELGLVGEEVPIRKNMIEDPRAKNVPASVLRVKKALIKMKDAEISQQEAIIAEAGYTKEEFAVIKSYGERTWGKDLKDLEFY